MRIDRYDDPAAFFTRAEPFLGAREAQHNLILGFRTILEQDPHAYGPHDPYLAVVTDGDAILAVATRTPPHVLCLSEVDDLAAVDALADDLAGDGPLPGVGGPIDATARFADAWSERTGARCRIVLDERVYEADAVSLPWQVPGRMRAYQDGDRDLVVAWADAFFVEALGAEPGGAERYVAGRARAADGGIVVWEDGGGEPVSFANYGSPTPNGIRIGPVYTPPERRGRGYASALTAALTDELLRGGRRFCFLFTNLANPTSNSIYQRIGYRPVADVSRWAFDPPA